MSLNIANISPLLHEMSFVVTRPIYNKMNFLMIVRIRLPYFIEKTANVVVIEGLIFLEHRTTNGIQVERAQYIQASSASCCFDCFFLAFSHPAITEFGALSRVNSVKKKDGLVFRCDFKIFIIFNKLSLFFCLEFMRDATRFFIRKTLMV